MENNNHAHKFTPGPWEYKVDYSDRSPRIVVEIPRKPFPQKINFGILGEDDCPSDKCCKTEEHANAKLTAAAPDLLEACQEALKELQYHNWQNTKTFNLIQEVIKKATE